MHPLTGGLAGLRVTGNDYLMAESLYQNLIFVPFLVGITH